MVKALYIMKASSASVNLTEGENGNPVFVPNGTIKTVASEQGCNGTQLLTGAQIRLLTAVQQHLSNYSNSSHFANMSQQLTFNSSAIDFANITTLLNFNYTSFGNLTQLFLANLTQLSNATFACKTSLFNQTQNLTSDALPIKIETLNLSQVKQDDAAEDAVTLPLARVSPDVEAAAQKAAGAQAAVKKAASDAQAAADAAAKKAASDAQATANAQAAADAVAAAKKAASDAQATVDAQAAADAKSAADAKAASDAQAAAESQAAAAAKTAADAQAAAANQAKAAASYAAPKPAAFGGNVLAGVSNVLGADGDAKATFFYQEGGYGACGIIHPDSTPLVALPPGLYANGAHCGKSVLIMNTANGKSVTATVQDMCPGCPSPTSLDLSTGAFDAIGAQATGVLPIQWGFTN